MKKVLLSILTFMAICSALRAQTPDFVWAKAVGGTSNEIVRSVGLDGLGDVYTVGSFEGSIDFDPGTGVSILTSNGGTDVFIQKLDANGNFVWAKNLGGTSYENPEDMAVDAAGNVYVTGSFQSAADFDPGAGIFSLTSNGIIDVFITKLDASGNFLWAKSMGGTDYDSGKTIDVDGLGNVYTTGYFKNTVDFNPGAGIYNLTQGGNSASFIQKLDLNGNFVWVKKLQGTGSAYINSVDIDALGNIHAVGYFDGTVDFDLGGLVHNITSNGYGDIFISKWDNNGDFVWSKSMGGSLDQDEANSVDVDAVGNVYTTGFYVGTVDFDPGVGVSNLLGIGTQDVFVSKLDASGNFVWAKSMGGTDYDVGNSVVSDASGNVYTTGYFRGSADFNPGVGVTNLISGGFDDVFVQKLDNNGDFVWANAITGTGINNGISIAVDDLNNLYTAGYFRNTADFDPEIGISNITSNGNFDVFIQKLKQCETIGSDTQVACNTYTWIDGITYTASNSSATHIMTNVEGCDSIVTLNLTINNSNTAIDVQAACVSYTWIDGNTYTTTNSSATHTLTNSVGCDSVVTLNLTINTNTGTDIQTACDTYVWIDGNTYTSSNSSATHTLTNTLGCDSVVTLNLTINNVDVGTDLTGTTISANNSSATNYQWITCLDSSFVVGETSADFTATANGDYAVIITEGSCTDTSACVTVLTVGINEESMQNVRVYPNPATSQITISNVVSPILTIKIIDISGKTIKRINHDSNTINVSDLTKGIYFLQVQTEQSVINKKFIKE
jgi:hypothetical protein